MASKTDKNDKNKPQNGSVNFIRQTSQLIQLTPQNLLPQQQQLPNTSHQLSDNALSEIEILDFEDFIQTSNTEDTSWVSNVSHDISQINTSNAEDTCLRYLGSFYTQNRKGGDKPVTFLFDTGSAIRVAPVNMIESINANYTTANPEDYRELPVTIIRQ